VHVWSTADDSQSVPIQYFVFQDQDDLAGSIEKFEKRVQVFSAEGAREFTSPGGFNGLFELNPKPPADAANDFSLGAPLAKAYEEFSCDFAGDETVDI
jgi:hypothetical protein